MKNPFMQIALEEAQKAMRCNEVPVGACIVLNDEVIARAYNQMRQKNDPTAHAEMLAIQKALKAKDLKRLDDCALYVTLEPCAMCAGAIALTHIQKLYYALPDKKMGAVEHNLRFFESPSCHHRPEIYMGIAFSQSQKLLQGFFERLRKKD